MVTVIAAIIGFFSALIPEIFNVIKLHYKNKNEELMLDKKIEMLKTGIKQSDYSQELCHEYYQEIYEPTGINIDSGIDRVGLVESLNAGVKPLLAYGFFFLYILIKFIQFYYAKHYILPFLDNIDKFNMMLSILWSDQDQAFLPMIVSAYFGQRSFNSYDMKKR